MHPPYFENPPGNGSHVPLPKRRPNCQVNEIIHFEGEDLRHVVGIGWSKTPISSPILLEVLGDVLEVVNLPSPKECPLPEDLRIRPPRHGSAKQPETVTADA